MQQPMHAIRGFSWQPPRRNLALITAVGALHLGAIVLLYEGLVPGIAPPTPPIFHLSSFKSVPQTTKVVLPPPTALHPIVVKVDPDVPPVKFEIKETITGPSHTALPHGDVGNAGPVTPLALPPSAPLGIAATHTTPDYPAMSRRLNEEGAVRLKLSIAPDGTVNDASVEHSSGYSRLDEAAVVWVKAHWRYRPATREGKPISSSVEAVVTFQLKKG